MLENALVQFAGGEVVGKWYGSAPLADGGDWVHKGQPLQMKFNNHSMFGKPKPDDAVINKIGAAYSESLAKLTEICSKVQIVIDDGITSRNPLLKCKDKMFLGDVLYDHFSPTKRKNVDLRSILDILTKTRDGLRDNSELNKVYLFTAASKPKDKLAEDTLGMVKGYGVDNAAKQNRPLVKQADGMANTPNNKTEYRQGHIHLNYDKMKSKSDKDVITTIIHEATHRFCGTCDFAYGFQPKYQNLTDAERLNNADSHALFCMAV